MYSVDRNRKRGIERLRTYFLQETQENYAEEKSTIFNKFVIETSDPQNQDEP